MPIFPTLCVCEKSDCVRPFTLCWPDQCCLTTREFPDGGLPGRLPVFRIAKPVVLFVSMDTCIDKCPQSGNSFFALSSNTRGDECYISTSHHFIFFHLNVLFAIHLFIHYQKCPEIFRHTQSLVTSSSICKIFLMRFNWEQ